MRTPFRRPVFAARRGRAAAAAVILLTAGAVAAATSAGAVSTGSTGSTAPSPAPVRTRAAVPDVLPGSYVALGDSYTSGPAIPTQLGPDTVPPAPAACHRSSADYPSLTARALGLQLVDASCSGATTDDVDRAQGPGIPAQLSALRPTTALVTVGLGGNDLGFSTIASNCAAYTPWGPTRVGWSCTAYYTAGGVDRLAALLQQVEAKVAQVLAEVHQRSPGANVFVIGYPDLLPPSGPGCWPTLPFRATDLDFLRGVEARLDAALASAATGAGDHFVDTAGPSRSHSACSDEGTRWVEGVLHSPESYPLHPDAEGMDGVAAVLEAVLEADGRADVRSAGTG